MEIYFKKAKRSSPDMTSLSNQNPGDWLFLPKLAQLNLALLLVILFGQPFSSSLYHKHILISPSFFTSQWKDSLHMFSGCQPISSAQSSPVYARDHSPSSLAIQLSCGTQAFIFPPPPLHIPFISLHLPLPLSYRALFRRLLVYICSICDACYTQYICS